MKRSIVCLLVSLGIWLAAKADHITGGEMYYTFLGASGGVYQYRITAKLFKDCHRNRQFPDPAIISVFDKATNSRIKDLAVPLANSGRLELSNTNKCITNPPDVCYDLAYYNFDLSLPGSPDGYLIALQIVFRINGISNLSSGYGNVGATFTAEIPSTTTMATAPQNNSARFNSDDMVVVCADNSFNYSFAAEDLDGDELRYSFCNAYQGGSFGGGSTSNPASPPPFLSVPYEGTAFTGSSPLGNTVTIDSKTGMIKGTAPASGTYVVTVCVEEIRNGKVIALQRKDLQINITSCTIAAASLLPEYQLCDDSKTLALNNRAYSPLIQTYYWEFSDQEGTPVFSSSSSNPVYTFSDTGLYKIKLIINRGQECSDSITSVARVYPGFKPGFEVNGICSKKPTRFSDATTSVYGAAYKWTWDFGDNDLSDDISTLQNPSYAYSGIGVKNVQLIVSNTNGCVDTISKAVSIVDKPPLGLAFRDTVICINDQLTLHAIGGGLFKWSPQSNITGSTTNSPTVTPHATTTYFVELDDGGCLNSDSVTVNVVSKVNVQAMNDTTICQGDEIRLGVVSDGLSYSWTPAEQLNDAFSKNPLAVTNATSTYEVTARIGGCSASDRILVKTVPYPNANAGNDTTICFATSAQLSGSMDGNNAVWSPAIGMNAANTLHPTVRPKNTTAYTLSVYDSKGCPKAGLDTVVITVLPDINASAGRDTAVSVGQPLQLQAKGGESYSWSPASNLSATDVSNPVAVYYEPSEGQLYKVLVSNEAGCTDSAFITVKVFQKGPYIYVPNAFTPNDDGRNDLLRPIAVGIQRIEQFIVYNRWGQTVFSTAENGNGWDGRINGKEQASGTYVWLVKAVDYNGKSYFRKGTAALIR
ncbi:gliding motility-associated C-terminal domain-containing protein [Chitinophagaceae bacterium LB-8]|uniref:Gliding motility-associated C-terminal domain-containing protein n=1 Tax=Paraflavisolibacter caeni TaxID=2982496 RepID=A0A9X2XVR0_9BACT|nr:PKD domain-containing protein [Paraflavisolibacter caeni]MCU7549496.1 gliding motility-associated C-terminal domain-containing protein [Paraflavisolibacter caeni]